MASLPELVDEPVGEDLGPSARERDLGPEDGDPHDRCARSVSSSACMRSTCAWRSSMSRRAAALNDLWSYASGSTYQRISLRRTALAGVPRPPRRPGRSRSVRSAETG